VANSEDPTPDHKKLQSKRRVILSDITLKIRHEDHFHNSRLNYLEAIDHRLIQHWIDTLCVDVESGSKAYDRRCRKIKAIAEIYNKILEKTYHVPTRLRDYHVRELLEVDVDREIAEQIRYLYDLEFKRWAEKHKRKEIVFHNKVRLDEKNSGHSSRIGLFDANNELMYGLWHNTLFTRIKPSARRQYITRTRLRAAALFGQKLVIDFGYEEYLNGIAAKQVMTFLAKLYEFNKYHLTDSYDLTFCNLNPNGPMSVALNNYFVGHPLHEYYIQTTADSYLNHYDYDKLCYICPQADEPLTSYDNDTVYILPAVCHHRLDPPLSMTRVKLEGIPMKRIPVEEYGSFRDGFHLEMAEHLEILSHFRDNNDMTKAMAYYLPQSVWRDERQVLTEDQEAIKRMFYMKKIGSQRKLKIYRSVDDKV
ncbi:unnamed protein product, partial [Medioppia subpectinata]